jgi:hypothetical protein
MSNKLHRCKNRFLLPARYLLITAVWQASSISAANSPHLNAEVVRLSNGDNNIDIDGDGVLDNVLLAWRENFNAHSYDVLVFLRRTEGKDHMWHIVPFFDSAGRQQANVLETIRGAECNKRAAVVVRQLEGPTKYLVIVAQKQLDGEQESKFRYLRYDLKRNTDGIVGWPELYWGLTTEQLGKSVYCDAEKALSAELSLLVK